MLKFLTVCEILFFPGEGLSIFGRSRGNPVKRKGGDGIGKSKELQHIQLKLVGSKVPEGLVSKLTSHQARASCPVVFCAWV